jgi:hypothetical protein
MPYMSTPQHVSTSNRKPQAPVRTTSLAESHRPSLISNVRPSIFQRLFGLRSSSQIRSPPLSPLTVTLESHDDQMPLITSSTTSSTSERASSSGYESTCNTVADDFLNSEHQTIKIRHRSTRKGKSHC